MPVISSLPSQHTMTDDHSDRGSRSIEVLYSDLCTTSRQPSLTVLVVTAIWQKHLYSKVWTAMSSVISSSLNAQQLGQQSSQCNGCYDAQCCSDCNYFYRPAIAPLFRHILLDMLLRSAREFGFCQHIIITTDRKSVV